VRNSGRWVVRQVQARIDPPDDGIEPAPARRGYAVAMIVDGKRVTVYVDD
jgi:hypothetical protein